jgi:hypothetical protein
VAGWNQGTELIERVRLANGTNAWIVAMTILMDADLVKTLAEIRARLGATRRTAPPDMQFPPADRIRAAVMGTSADGVSMLLDMPSQHSERPRSKPEQRALALPEPRARTT